MRELLECLVCRNKSLHLYANFGNQPLANNFLPDDFKQDEYPLQLFYCQNCTHSQLGLAIDPKLMFQDYCYVSGTTERLRKHFRDLATTCLERIYFPIRSDVISHLDIACNDGSLNQAFREVVNGCPGFVTMGVDPATNLQIESFKKGIPVLVDYWTEELGKEFPNTFDVITALNCLAHNSNPRDFLLGIKHALKEDGLAIIEVPSHAETLKNIDFGQVYFEHYSYFTPASLFQLARSCGFSCQLDHIDIHNGSIRAYLKKGPSNMRGKMGNYDSLIDNFEDKVLEVTELLLETLCELKEEGFSIVAYGASAKSVTLWNFAKHTYPDLYSIARPVCTLDDNPLKVNKFIPNTDIQIGDVLDLDRETKIAFICTANNFREEIKKRLIDKGLGGKGNKIVTYHGSNVEVTDL